MFKLKFILYSTIMIGHTGYPGDMHISSWPFVPGAPIARTWCLFACLESQMVLFS
jgi:hypothetical protein